MSVSRPANIAAVVVAIVLPSLVTLLYFKWLADFPPSIQQVSYGLGKTAQFAFPIFWVALMQRRLWSAKQERDNQEKGWSLARGLVIGLGFGTAVVLLMLAIYHVLLRDSGLIELARPHMLARVEGLGIDSMWKYVALGFFYSLVHSLLEEYYFRWFVFGQLRQLTTLVTAILISSLAFMAHHVIVLSEFFGWWSFTAIFFSLSIAVGGAVWAWLYERSGSLAGPWMSHLVVDAGIFLIGYDVVKSAL